MSQPQKQKQPSAAKEQVTSSPNQITFEQIAARAYEIYTERGDKPGSDVEDWLEAERQLNQMVEG